MMRPAPADAARCMHPAMRGLLVLLSGVLLAQCGGDGATAVEMVTSVRFVTQPQNAAAGQAFSVSVELLNQSGSRMTSGGQTVTLSLVGGTATLTGSTSAVAAAGLATFSGLSVTTTGTNLVFLASAGNASAVG